MRSAVACGLFQKLCVGPGDDLARLAGRHRLIVLIPDLQLGEGQRHAASTQRLRAGYILGEPLTRTHHRNR